MKLMGYVKDELTTSAGFVVEFKRLPKPAVRLLNHDPNPIDDHVIYPAELTPKLKKLADKDGFIPLEQFFAYAKQFVSWKNRLDYCNKLTFSVLLRLEVSMRQGLDSLHEFIIIV